MKHLNPAIETLLARLATPRLATIDLSLDRIFRLLAALGNPHKKLRNVVHVAGTNGKGSLVAYLTAILQTAGYTVNRFTSPHLVAFNEQIFIENNEITDTYLLTLLERLMPFLDACPVTAFEAHAALAFMAFAQNPSDVVLLETGLGGRLDATNVISSPLLTAITPVSIDHSEFLGDNLAAIAGEKAGIIKRGVACVLGRQEPEAMTVLERQAESLGAPLYRYEREWRIVPEGNGFIYASEKRNAHFPLPNLNGKHQVMNAATAIACIDRMAGLNVTNEQIASGVTQALWPARLQRLASGALADLLPPSCELWLDGGHNPAAGIVLADWIKGMQLPVHMVCGLLANKDARQFIAPFAPYIRSFSAIPIENAVPFHSPALLANMAREAGIKSFFFNNVRDAIQEIARREASPFAVIICGSLYLAGNILRQNGPLA